MNGSKPFGPSGHPPALAKMGTHSAVGSSVFPSPRPSPPRRGGILDRELANPRRADSPHRGTSFSLSLAAYKNNFPSVGVLRRRVAGIALQHFFELRHSLGGPARLSKRVPEKHSRLEEPGLGFHDQG